MKIKNNLMEIMVSVGVLILLIYSSDPVIKGDSNRYIDGNIIDPPFLSILISIMLTLFGNLKSIIIFQTIIIGFSIVHFTRTICTFLNLDNYFKILIALFLFLPIIKFYNYLLTETFGYAFSLLFVSFAVQLIYNFNSRNIFWVSIFVILLILLRKQFIFLYPILVILYIGIFIIKKSKKTFIKLTISFLSILLISSYLISLNKNIDPKNTERENYSDLIGYGPFYFTYIDSIYISTIKDVQLFKSTNVQKTLTKIFTQMNNDKKLVKYYDGRGHFAISFASIRDYSESQLINLAAEEKTTVYNLKKKISLTLITANFQKYLYLIFKKFYDATWLFIFVPFFMTIAAFRAFIKFKSHFSLLVIFVSSFSLANHSVIYIFGRVQPRYLIYSDFILLVFIFILLSILFKKKI